MTTEGVVKVSYPRKDVPVAVDGWKMPPFMGLTSWAAFSPGQEGKSEAMVRRYAHFAPEQMRKAADRLATFWYTATKQVAAETPQPVD